MNLCNNERNRNDNEYSLPRVADPVGGSGADQREKSYSELTKENTKHDKKTENCLM